MLCLFSAPCTAPVYLKKLTRSSNTCKRTCESSAHCPQERSQTTIRAGASATRRFTSSFPAALPHPSHAMWVSVSSVMVQLPSAAGLTSIPMPPCMRRSLRSKSAATSISYSKVLTDAYSHASQREASFLFEVRQRFLDCLRIWACEKGGRDAALYHAGIMHCLRPFPALLLPAPIFSFYIV